MENINLKNTLVSFTPSFSGNGWETSLVPRFDRGHGNDFQFRITFGWLKRMLLKMQSLGHLPAGRQGRWEVKQWTTAIARLFL